MELPINESLSDIFQQDETIKFLNVNSIEKILIVRNDEGEFVKRLNELKNEITLIDNRKEAIEKLKEYFKEHPKQPTLEYGGLENLSFPDQSFEIIIARASLRHFNNPLQGLKEINRVLKRNGKFLLHEMSFPANLIQLFDALSYIVRGKHAFYWNYNDITTMLREVGFKISLIRPTEYKSNNFTRRIKDHPELEAKIFSILDNLDNYSKKLLRFEKDEKGIVMWYETYDILCTK